MKAPKSSPYYLTTRKYRRPDACGLSIRCTHHAGRASSSSGSPRTAPVTAPKSIREFWALVCAHAVCRSPSRAPQGGGQANGSPGLSRGGCTCSACGVHGCRDDVSFLVRSAVDRAPVEPHLPSPYIFENIQGNLPGSESKTNAGKCEKFACPPTF
eukprot:5434301-Prymnesium_polylepis.2